MKELKRGSSGNDVKELQSALNGAGYPLTVDGVFGVQTENAVKQFQTAKGLTVDGVCGVQTWAALKTPTNTQLYNAFITCLYAIEQLPEFKQLEKMLYG
ncbi:MAG: peptidoglycan-binding protein [Clostridia bacterium]|nr:peptidoglycan-binding protein [Clostridia bacterium]